VGTTRAASGSADNFVKIDREYVLAAARAALTEEKSATQRLLYCSTAGANSSSFFLYPKSKGLTEEGLGELKRGVALNISSNRFTLSI
jgi:oxidoreductase